MEVIVKDRKLVVPRKSLKEFVQKEYLKSIIKKDYYDFDEAKKYNDRNTLLAHYQNYLDDVLEIDDKHYENFDFIEVNNTQYIKLNYVNEWFGNLRRRSASNNNILYKKWGNYYISYELIIIAH